MLDVLSVGEVFFCWILSLIMLTVCLWWIRNDNGLNGSVGVAGG